MEIFCCTLKSEQTHHCVYNARYKVPTDLFYYIESVCNQSRRHSAVDYLSPEVCEQLFYQQET